MTERMTQKLDLLAFGAHPDDVEISASGAIARQVQLGYQVGIVDLTQGEMGTRGTAAIRLKEAEAAAHILGVAQRHNLAMEDGKFANDWEHQLKIIELIRAHRPETLLLNAPTDRHPDHGRGAELVRTAAFLAGLKRIETLWYGQPQEAHRPQMMLHYIQFQDIQPDFILDISGFMDLKLEAIQAYRSQFYDPQSEEPETVISSKGFLESIRYRSKNMGRLIGTDYGEGFIAAQPLGVSDLMTFKGVR